jgi:hypothetical protein
MKNNAIRVSCNDCYFRCASLCALQLDEPCPTFRHHARGALAPPQSLRLTARPLDEIAQTRLVAQPAAA